MNFQHHHHCAKTNTHIFQTHTRTSTSTLRVHTPQNYSKNSLLKYGYLAYISVQTLSMKFLFLLSVLPFTSGFRSIKTSRKYVRVHGSESALNSAYNFDALLFDCDGVIAETERDAHRISFNKAFAEKGLSNIWEVEEYGELLKIGGGKERMTAYFDKVGWPSEVPEENRKKFIQELHLLKTSKFESCILSGAVPLRPGVMRLMDDALSRNIPVAVCSTSNEQAVKMVIRTLLGIRINRIRIFAGDIVEKKKPSPDIYLLAAKELEVQASRCWVIEDSEIGLRAAKAAGMKCLVTKSVYTQNEDFKDADGVVSDLDHGIDGLITVPWLNYKAAPKTKTVSKAMENAELFAATPDYSKMFNKIISGNMPGTPGSK